MSFSDSTDFGDDIELLLAELEAATEDRDLTREERAVIDVVDAIRLIEGGEGLHEFWQSDLNHSQIMNSFDIIGSRFERNFTLERRCSKGRKSRKGNFSFPTPILTSR